MGTCDRKSKEITLSNDLDKQTFMPTLLHEVVHAFLWESGMSQFLSVESEEMISEMLPRVLLKNFKVRN